MQLAVQDLEERARWAIAVRWFACLLVVLATFTTSTLLSIVPAPAPLYGIAAAMLAYNTALHRAWTRRRTRSRGEAAARTALLLQVTLDLLALTLLLYFTDLQHNPLVACYFFHVVIASILLPGATPYMLVLLASLLVGSVVLLQQLGAIPVYHLQLAATAGAEDGFLFATLLAFSTCLFLTVYFVTSVSRQVQRAQAKIRQQEKMLGISQLVAGFAHQINNPLDGLQNCLRQVRARANGDERTANLLRLMQDGIARMCRLARRLQEFARPGGLHIEPMDAVATVDAALQMLDDPCREHRVFLQREVAQVPQALGDAHAVQEVLFNLGTNAVAAMPGGGDLTFRLFAMPRTDVGDHGAVVIDVVDNGVGIATEHQQHIFEPFYTTRADHGGSGLGLGLCRMLLAEMGGRIEMRSVPGRGSTFRVILPATPAMEVAACASS